MLRRYLSSGVVPLGYFYDLNFLSKPCRWTGPTLTNGIMVESARKGGKKVLAYKDQRMPKEQVFIELYRHEKTVTYARYYRPNELSNGKAAVASQVKNIYSPSLMVPSPPELVSCDPSIPSVLTDRDLGLSVLSENFISLDEFNSLLKAFSKGDPPNVSHYMQSLKSCRRYFIEEERQLTTHLISVLREKMSGHYKDLVITNEPIVSKALPLSESSTSRPDMYLYNSGKLLHGLNLKAASVHPMLEMRLVDGLAVECKRNANPIGSLIKPLPTWCASVQT